MDRKLVQCFTNWIKDGSESPIILFFIVMDLIFDQFLTIRELPACRYLIMDAPNAQKSPMRGRVFKRKLKPRLFKSRRVEY